MLQGNLRKGETEAGETEAMKAKIRVVLTKPRLRVVRGTLETDEKVGSYRVGLQKGFFAVPQDVVLSFGGWADKKPIPFFVVDPETDLALPIGVATVDDPALPLRLAAICEKRVVKALTMKMMDLVMMIIVGAAGLGIGLFLLRLFGRL